MKADTFIESDGQIHIHGLSDCYRQTIAIFRLYEQVLSLL